MTDITIGRYQTIDVIELDTYSPGTFVKTMEIRGNAILSSLFIKSADPGATVKINYFQTTSGTIDVSERQDLSGHPIKAVADAGSTETVVVTRVHNKPVLEYVIAGGDVEFGVYVTVTDELASDIDSALVLDAETANLLIQKGIPMACYNEGTGLWEIMRCPFPVVLSDEGDPFHIFGTKTDVADVEVTLASFTVAAATTRKLKKLVVSAFGTGIWTLDAGGSTIAKGRTESGYPDSIFTFDPKQPIATGTLVTLKFLQISSFSALTVDHHIMGSDIT